MTWQQAARVWGAVFLGAMVLAVGSASVSWAGLVFVGKDARADYPNSAPVYTSHLPAGPSATEDSRGVRSNRIQTQTFRVAEPLSVESIFLGYRWNSNDDLPITFRLIEVDDVGVVHNPAAVNVLAGPLTVTIGDRPNPAQAADFYALELKWDAGLSGGQELILTPRVGQQGYALEIVGSSTSVSPIALLTRLDNPLAGGRAIEQNLSGAATGPNQSVDFVMAITGHVVPEPAAAMLAMIGGCGAAACGLLRRRASS